jgi:hypothetical protein
MIMFSAIAVFVVMTDSTRIKNPNINSLLNRYFMTMLHAFQEL